MEPPITADAAPITADKTRMSGETIKGVKVRAVKVPMTEPHRTASGVITESPLVLVDVETSRGVVGHGMVFTYTAAALQPVAELVANLEALVKGQPLAPAQVTRGLLSRFKLLGTHGLVGIAISAIDMAMWDALARAREMPLCRVLGAAPRPIRAYGGVGYDGVKDSASAAERWAKRGFKGVKAKIGYPTVAEDLAVIRAMRSAVGPDVAVMVDYNQSLPKADAIARLRQIDGEGLAWIEEPVIAEDYAGMAEVARAISTPIQAGENWWGPLEFAKAIAAGASDLLMPDVMKVFGVTGWMEVAAQAAAHDLPVSCHLFCEVSAQLLAATHTAHWLEYADWWNPVLAQPLEVRDGMAFPADRPGSGVEWK
jgi:mandelate racemase